MFIDTHSHFGLGEEPQLQQKIERAKNAGVLTGLITTAQVADLLHVERIAEAIGWGYAVGIHPLFVQSATDRDLLTLESFLADHRGDPRLVAVGEIGLDRYEPDDYGRQEAFFEAQLTFAQSFALPVSVHSRRAVFRAADYLAKYPTLSVALHAFSGSVEEAYLLARRGYKFGFGGAVTFEGSKRVRSLLKALPAKALLLETDAPDMAPAFAKNTGSEPAFLAKYLEVIGEIRDEDIETLKGQIYRNSLAAFPKLARLVDAAP